jgi:Ca2+/Na+ antiporter
MAIGGIFVYSQVCGLARPLQFFGFAAGLLAVLAWIYFTRRVLRRQAAVLMLLLAYVLVVPVILAGKFSGLVFIGGMLLPILIVFCALYFGAFRSKSDRESSTDSARKPGP